jgi:hypothetical protein
LISEISELFVLSKFKLLINATLQMQLSGIFAKAPFGTLPTLPIFVLLP